MFVKLYLFLLFLAVALTGCNNKKPIITENEGNFETYKIHYAKGFSVKKYTDYTLVSVRNPWDSTQILQQYILIDRQKDLPPTLPKGTIIRTPLKKVVAYSTIHCSTLNELNTIGIVKGVCESQYIKTPAIRKGLEQGVITDVGMGSNPDIEKIIMLNPEALLAFPISGQTYGSATKTGIPIIETPDYTEPEPLGRAEWIRFYSLFVGKEQLADSMFAATVQRYNEVKDKVKGISKRKTVFTDTRYQSVWQMPGGKSFMANMLKDAGADYVWRDTDSNTFHPLSFEVVLDKAGEADVWMIKYNSATQLTYSGLENEYKPYSYFRAFKERNIWGCNTNNTLYYEDMPIHPDYILIDFAAMLYPELFPDYTQRYYKRLGE